MTDDLKRERARLDAAWARHDAMRRSFERHATFGMFAMVLIGPACLIIMAVLHYFS